MLPPYSLYQLQPAASAPYRSRPPLHLTPLQSKLLEAELSRGELLAARDRALSTAERAEARMKQVEKGVDEHR